MAVDRSVVVVSAKLIIAIIRCTVSIMNATSARVMPELAMENLRYYLWRFLQNEQIEKIVLDAFKIDQTICSLEGNLDTGRHITSILHTD